jgi:hypothetical protein
MITNRRLPIVLACGMLLAVTACDRTPPRMASGDEIGEAVKNAEAEMAEARAKRLAEPDTDAFGPEKVLAARTAEH